MIVPTAKVSLSKKKGVEVDKGDGKAVEDKRSQCKEWEECCDARRRNEQTNEAPDDCKKQTTPRERPLFENQWILEAFSTDNFQASAVSLTIKLRRKDLFTGFDKESPIFIDRLELCSVFFGESVEATRLS